MQAVKNKLKSTIKNKKNERLKSIYKDTNSMLSLKQPKNLYRELTSPRFMSNFANIRKPGTYKWSDKTCKLCQNYLNEINKLTMSNGQVWQIRRKIDCHSVNVIYYLKFKKCNEKETYIRKTIGDNTKGLKLE